MSIIGPDLKEKFESLPTELQAAILSRGENLTTLNDLVRCLESIVEGTER